MSTRLLTAASYLFTLQLFSLHCAPPCTSGEQVCRGENLLRCKSNQTWQEIRCAQGKRCVQGLCQTVYVLNDASPDHNTPTPDHNTPTPDHNTPTPDHNTPTPDNNVPTPDNNVPTPDNASVDNTGACAPGTASQCLNQSTAKVCVQGRWQTQTCPSGQSCQAGTCKPFANCQDGSKRCIDNTSFEICTQGNWQTQACPSGQSCQFGLCSGSSGCTDGQTTCQNSTTRLLCQNKAWQTQTCPSGQSCQAGTCKTTSSCQDGQTRCQDSQNLQRCVSGSWQTQPCTSGSTCQNNACTPQSQCTDGARRCAGQNAQELCQSGQWNKTNCTANQTCQKDRCTTTQTGTCPNPCSSGQVCKNGTCVSWPHTYRKITFVGNKTDRDPPQHGDLNLKLRGWQAVSGESKNLLQYNGATDPNAPKLYDMFSSGSFPGIVNNYKVRDWDWSTNSRGGWITSTYWKVHLVGFRTTPGDTIRAPSRGPDIAMGWARCLVLYVDQDSITFVYTAEDTIANGYAVHINGIHVAVDLARLYQQTASRSTKELPALSNKQPIGTAIGNEVRVAIRDRGAFMDPRSKKDWW